MRGARRALLSVASLCLAASAALAADPYAEYRIPEHRWLAWTASANAGGLHRSSSGYFGTSYTDGQLNASASSSLTGGFDSDATSHAYFLTLEFAADRARSTDHEEFPSILDQDETRRTASQFAEAFLAWSRYPHAVPIGLSLGTAGSFGLGQTWDSNQAHEVTPPSATRSQSSGSQGSYVANASLTASLSLGRVRDATPVYQAQVLEQRLREAGTITRELSPAARERLASLYTIEHDLSFAHQRPTKYFWRELERLLREDGVLGEGGLDAYSVQKLLEPLTIVGSGAVARARGLAIGPQVALQKYWTHRSLHASGSSSYYQSDTLVDVIQYSADHSTDSQNDRILSGMFADFHPAGGDALADRRFVAGNDHGGG